MSIQEHAPRTGAAETAEVPEWQLPVIGMKPKEIEEWAAFNIEVAKTALEATVEPLRDLIVGDERFSGDGAKAKKIFYLPTGASSREAKVVSDAALALLDLTFAQKDWVKNEATSSFNRKNDILNLVVRHNEDGSLDLRSGMHCTLRPEPGVLMPAERAMWEDWKKDPVAVYNQAEAEGLYDTKDLAEAILNTDKVLEVYTVATLPDVQGAGDAIAQMGLTSVRTREDNGIKVYTCIVDDGLGRMLHRKKAGYKPLPGLPRKNFHSNRPDSNSSTVQLCIADEWRQEMLDPESPAYEPAHHDRFWKLGRALTSLDIHILE
jgi:hypothetical protein